MADYPQKLTGSMGWTSKQAETRRVILHSENELAIEFDYCGWRYTVKLQRNAEGQFEGTYQMGQGMPGGSVTCKLYPTDQGYILFGRWFETGTLYHWWAELETVERFPDEA